jgi:hypothetical protein
MDYIVNWVEQYEHLLQLGGEVGTVVGILLFVTGRRIRSTSVSAGERSVAIGRDNHGAIITGDVGASSPRTNTNWPSIIGLLLTFASLVVTTLAWLAPVKP